jgi:hypothetical protein
LTSQFDPHNVTITSYAKETSMPVLCERAVPHWVVVMEGGYFWSSGHNHGHWDDQDADVMTIARDFLHEHPEHADRDFVLEYWDEWRKPIKSIRLSLK